MSKISIFQHVSVAEQTGLNLTLSETPKTGFLVLRPTYLNTLIALGYYTVFNLITTHAPIIARWVLSVLFTLYELLVFSQDGQSGDAI